MESKPSATVQHWDAGRCWHIPGQPGDFRIGWMVDTKNLGDVMVNDIRK